MIQRILGGEPQLFRELIRPYERQVYMSALAILRSEADAEEAAQDAFIKAFTHLHQFRFEAKFSTWLISITINEARGRIRSTSRLKEESLDVEPEKQSFSPAVLTDWREVPLACLEQMELRHALREAAESLPVIYREVFTCRDVEGLPIGETAEVLGISVGVVKTRLHRARMMLQRSLVPYLKSRYGEKRRSSWF